MKTLAQSLFIALLSTAALAAPATITPTESIKPVKVTVDAKSYKVAVFPSSAMASKLNVIVERQPGQSMTVLLKSTQGEVIARQYVNKKQGNVRFQFNLSALQDGDYRVEVASGDEVTVHSIKLSSQSAQAATRTIALN